MTQIGQLKTNKSMAYAMSEIRDWLQRIGINGMNIDLRYDSTSKISLCKFKYKEKEYEFRSSKQKNCILNMHGIARVMEYKVRSHLMGIEDFEKSMSSYLQLPNYSEFSSEPSYSKADEKDYFTLGVNKLSSNDEISKRYRELCKTYHPDMANSEEAKEMMSKKISEINEAYTNIK